MRGPIQALRAVEWVAIALAAAIFVIDLFTTTGVAEWMLYVVPFAVIASGQPNISPRTLASACTALIVLGLVLSPAGIALQVSAANRALGVMVIWIVAWLLDHRRAAEAEVREREARLRAIFETEPECVKLLAADGTLLEMNPAGLEMLEADSFGWVARQCVYPLVTEEHRPAFRALTERVFAGESATLQFEIVGLKGTHRWLETHASPLRDELGRVTALLGVTRDITGSKQMEAALRQGEAKFAMLFNRAPFAALLSRLSDGAIVEVNDAFVNAFGYSREDVIGRTSIELGIYSMEARRRVSAEFRERRAVRDHELALRTKSRAERVVLLNAEPVEIGDQTYVLSTTLDITDRKMAEAALRDSEQRLRLALDAAHMGIFDWDVQRDHITWSHWHEELWGFAPGEFGGTYESFAERVHADDLPGIEAELARCRVQRTPFTREFRVVWQDSSVHWITGRGEFRFNDAGEAVRMLGTVVETTARKRTEEALRNLSHRLMKAEDNERRRIAKELHDSTAQDLAAVMMVLDPLRDTITRHGGDGRRLDDAMAILEKSAHDLRTLAYLLHPPRLDEAGLAGAIRYYVEGFSERTNLPVELCVPDELPRPSSDTELVLFRVLQESLTNIHRHASSPTAGVRLSREDGGLLLEVEDAGRGIPPDVLEAVPAVGPGLGVGIPAMRERLQYAGGRLKIESGPAGTRVRAFVPVNDP